MNEITIGDRGLFSTKGKIRDKNFRFLDLSELLEKILKIHKELGAEYAKSIQNDQKLIGQEKAALISCIDSISDAVVTLRYSLEKILNPNDDPECNYPEDDFYFKISLIRSGYRIEGKMSQEYLSAVDSFYKWYNEIFSVPLNQFLSEFKEGLKDRELTRDEIPKLIRPLDYMIHHLAVIYLKLEQTQLSS